MQYYISFKCPTKWFSIFVFCEMITTVSLVNSHPHVYLCLVFFFLIVNFRASQVALAVEYSIASAGDTGDVGLVLGLGRSLEEGMMTQSSIHAWRIPLSEQPGRLWPTESQHVGHNWNDLVCPGILKSSILATFKYTIQHYVPPPVTILYIASPWLTPLFYKWIPLDLLQRTFLLKILATLI